MTNEEDGENILCSCGLDVAASNHSILEVSAGELHYHCMVRGKCWMTFELMDAGTSPNNALLKLLLVQFSKIIRRERVTSYVRTNREKL